MPVIKRYANRKLYDTAAGQYVTLEEIRDMVLNGADVRVLEHETDTDVTTLTLAQIIFEQEKRAGGLLPTALLTQIIQMGENTVQEVQASVRAFIDPETYFSEQLAARLSRLMEKSKIAAEEKERWLKLLTQPVRQRQSPLSPTDAATQAEVQAALQQLEALEQKVAALRQSASSPST